MKKKVTALHQPVRKQGGLQGKQRETRLHGAARHLQKAGSRKSHLQPSQERDESQASRVQTECELGKAARWLVLTLPPCTCC